jgi:ribosomal protein S18 acetylase RimI-like enzyme
MNIKLRPAAAEDRNALWQVHTQAIRVSAAGHYDAAQIEAWAGRLTPEGYQRCPDCFFVAEAEESKVIGFGELNLKSGEIEALFVDPEFGRRGIGSHLLQALEDLARRQGLTTLILETV